MEEIDRGELKGKAINGIIALTSRTLLLQIISLIAFSLLTFYLTPTTIGIFGAAMAAMKLFTLFTDIGFGAALIQKKEKIEEDDLKTTFTLQEILVVTVVIVGLLLSSSISSYFHLSSQGLWLFRTLIVILFISSLKTIPSILMERKIEFGKQIFPQIVEALIFNILVVILAIKGFQVASFTWAFLISSIVSLPIYYYLAPWKIGFGIKKSVAKRILFFGTPYQFKSILGVIKDDLIKLYATRTVGLSGLGYIEWGQRWAFSPFRFIVDSITKVTFPTFARLQEEKNILKKAIERSLFSVSLIMFPVMIGMIISAPYFINLIPKYGKWQLALPSLYFFCINAAVSSLSNILVNVLDAIGKVKITLIMMIIWTILTWILTPIGIIILGPTGVAAAGAIVTLTIFITIYFVNKYIPFNFLPSIWKPLIISLLMGLVIYFERKIIGYSWIGLFLMIVSGVIIYLLGVLLIAKEDISEIISIIKKRHD